MSDVQRGNIVDYTVPASASAVMTGALAEDEIVPLLVVSVDDEAESYSGFAFLPDGTTEYVTYTTPPPAPPAAKFDAQTGEPITLQDDSQADLQASIDALTPDQRAQIMAALNKDLPAPTPPPAADATPPAASSEVSPVEAQTATETSVAPAPVDPANQGE